VTYSSGVFAASADRVSLASLIFKNVGRKCPLWTRRSDMLTKDEDLPPGVQEALERTMAGWRELLAYLRGNMTEEAFLKFLEEQRRMRAQQ
jgi:hypothetical protein